MHTNTDRFPEMILVEQDFDQTAIFDPENAVHGELDRFGLEQNVGKGQTVAIAIGSRGIRNLDRIVRTLCQRIHRAGAHPYIVPAMGSHGNATAEGQEQILQSLDVSRESTGAEIRSSMEVKKVGSTRHGFSVYVDKEALNADHIVAVNRIKAHTKFKGPVESGIMKMLAVGLSNHKGAALLHREAILHSFPEVILAAADTVLSHCKICFGLGIVENALGQTRTIKVMGPETLQQEEEHLLAMAKDLAPKIPVDPIDLLIVDEIGKNISGTGMDTNVTGRNRDLLGEFQAAPTIKRILVRDLSPGTKGNALGIGFADFTTSRVIQAMDRQKTYTNALTGISPEKAAIPMYFDNDRDAIAAALNSLGAWGPDSVRVVRIKNTADLQKILLSRALSEKLPDRVHAVGTLQKMRFNDNRNLTDFLP